MSAAHLADGSGGEDLARCLNEQVGRLLQGAVRRHVLGDVVGASGAEVGLGAEAEERLPPHAVRIHDVTRHRLKNREFQR